MSSTNRGYERHKTDYYVTPKHAVEDFLGAWLQDLSNEDEWNDICERPDRVMWLDPCAGGDENHEMTYPSVLKEQFGVEARTLDIREDSLASEKVDYLEADLVYAPTVIITNPPFYLAKEIIEKALEDVRDDGYVVMLLRLNFFGSKARFPFFQEHLPERVYVHHRRFSFTDDGNTDSIEYMHAVWKKGVNPEYSKLKVI